MKKTLTVNLGGIVFNMDEDAYRLLDQYLSGLRIHFSREEGTDEIMDDFEARISELLSDRIRKGLHVITIGHVEDVIKRMGKPEEIFAAEEEKQGPEEKETATPTEPAQKPKKRLMRDPDDRMIAGVASGLAAYWGYDVTAVRLIWVILALLPVPLPMVIVYLILWLVVPVARTVADRLTMRGERVDLENIGKTVSEAFDNANAFIHSEKPRSALQKTADLIVSFVGILLKITVAVLLGIILIPVFLAVVLVLVTVIIALIAGGIGSVPFVGEDFGMMREMPGYVTVFGCVGGILLLGIPLAALISTFCGRFLKLSPVSTASRWMLVVIWFISLILCSISVYTVIRWNAAHAWFDWDSTVGAVLLFIERMKDAL
jgi:phage shock protein PspC (stress-responsive transcriptional regulator)